MRPYDLFLFPYPADLKIFEYRNEIGIVINDKNNQVCADITDLSEINFLIKKLNELFVKKPDTIEIKKK